jgi:hypothetical protein
VPACLLVPALSWGSWVRDTRALVRLWCESERVVQSRCIAIVIMDEAELLKDEILNLRKKLMEKEAMLRQHLTQVRIVKLRCR